MSVFFMNSSGLKLISPFPLPKIHTTIRILKCGIIIELIAQQIRWILCIGSDIPVLRIKTNQPLGRADK